MASKQVLIPTCVLSLAAIHLTPATAAPAAQVITCVDLATGKERISKTGTCRTTEATAKWHLAQSDSALASGGTTKSLTICSNKESSPVTYQRIRTSCYKHMQTNLYTRSAALPSKPVITQVSSTSYESASLALASDPAANLDAPIAYYTITSSKGDVKKVNSWRELTVAVSGLSSSTLYTFTISATSVDGTSPVSESSLPVTTQVYVAPVAAATTAPLAAPAFTLSTSAETKTVNTAITGYTISSTGGTIASYAISPSAPAGTTFSSSTGLLTGTPSSTQSATAYTITATNATGSATRTFTLTVTAIVYSVGDRGPGGGIVFYVSAAGFNCGPTFSSTGSPNNGKCHYLEAAPNTWHGGIADPKISWATDWKTDADGDPVFTPVAGANSTQIGSGYKNSLAISLTEYGNVASSSAAVAARSYTSLVSGMTYSDWYLPSKDELNELYGQRTILGTSIGWYWSSSEGYSSDGAYWPPWAQYFNNGSRELSSAPFEAQYSRPIRSF